MLPTRIARAKHAYQPMIKFLGNRANIEYGGSHAPAPHPAAPQEIVDNFQSFLAKLQSTSGGADSPSSTPKGQSTSQSAQGKTPSDTGAGQRDTPDKLGKPVDFENFWEAPGRLWQIKEVTDREIEAIMSGGATDIRSGP